VNVTTKYYVCMNVYYVSGIQMLEIKVISKNVTTLQSVFSRLGVINCLFSDLNKFQSGRRKRLKNWTAFQWMLQLEIKFDI
jgi:hypothetical protein